MPTPEEVIDEAAREAWCSMKTHHEHIIEALDTAGYTITAKLPPNAAVWVQTDETGAIVQFKQRGEEFSFDAPDAKKPPQPEG